MARKRLGKRERAAMRAKRQQSELVSMDMKADYGSSCLAKLHDFKPGSKSWEYNSKGQSKTAKAKRERDLRRIGKAIKLANQ